jgi:hypothetical protein
MRVWKAIRGAETAETPSETQPHFDAEGGQA